jgi:hypothetical protein
MMRLLLLLAAAATEGAVTHAIALRNVKGQCFATQNDMFNHLLC